MTTGEELAALVERRLAELDQVELGEHPPAFNALDARLRDELRAIERL